MINLNIIVKRQYGFIGFKYKINWSKSEFKNKLKDIVHQIVRVTLKYFKINFSIEISTFLDIPAGTGLGSSGTFAVGLINGISKILNKKLSKKKIAEIAFFIEENLLKRQIRKQDHYSAIFRRLNKIIFKKTKNVKVKKEVNNFEHFFSNKKPGLKKISELLNEQWSLKKKVNNLVRSVYLNKIYNRCFNGGKLLGERISGFYLLTCNNLTMRKTSSIFGSNNEI